MSGYWICCNCDAPLSCDACGVEQPDDSDYFDAIESERNKLRGEVSMLMADNIRLRRSEASVDLMRRVWANLYFNEKEAGGTFQQTLSEVVDWLAARNALPDVREWATHSLTSKDAR